MRMRRRRDARRVVAEMIRYRFAHRVIVARPKLNHPPLVGVAGET
jgi:hypothetical protein